MPAAANNTDIAYLESRFTYAFSKPHGEREYRKLEESDKEKVLERLKELHAHTWQEVVNMKRERGLTLERKDAASYRKTQGRDHRKHPPHQVYPFHLRVPSISSAFRVFGYQFRATLYITQIDPHHKQHRTH